MIKIDSTGSIYLHGQKIDIYDYVDTLEAPEIFAAELAELRSVLDGVIDYIEDESIDRNLVNGIFE